jgi:hypothetical protein
MLRAAREPELVDGEEGGGGCGVGHLPADGGRAELTTEQADAWLAALNDVRLALGTTLGVTEDMPDEPPADETLAAHLSVYHWLTFVQDALVQTLAT